VPVILEIDSAEVVVRLLSMHVTCCKSERSWSLKDSLCSQARNRKAVTRVNTLVTIRGNSSMLHQAVLSVEGIKHWRRRLSRCRHVSRAAAVS
jgi:hypothetical protein